MRIYDEVFKPVKNWGKTASHNWGMKEWSLDPFFISTNVNKCEHCFCGEETVNAKKHEKYCMCGTRRVKAGWK